MAESMTLASFAEAVYKTAILLREKSPGTVPLRQPGHETRPGHLLWMLDEAIVFYAGGKPQKANRWLGFVQGSMAADGYSDVEQLKRANMPEGEAFEEGKV